MTERCDHHHHHGMDVTGIWEDESGTVYRLNQVGSRVSGILHGSARSGHPNLTGTLEGEMEGRSFTGAFRNQEPAVGSPGVVWSAGPAYFMVTEHGRLEGHMPGMLHWNNDTESRPLDIVLSFRRIK